MLVFLHGDGIEDVEPRRASQADFEKYSTESYSYSDNKNRFQMLYLGRHNSQIFKACTVGMN